MDPGRKEKEVNLFQGEQQADFNLVANASGHFGPAFIGPVNPAFTPPQRGGVEINGVALGFLIVIGLFALNKLVTRLS